MGVSVSRLSLTDEGENESMNERMSDNRSEGHDECSMNGGEILMLLQTEG